MSVSEGGGDCCLSWRKNYTPAPTHPRRLAQQQSRCVLLLPVRRDLPAIYDEGIAAMSADQLVTDVQPGAASAYEFPSPRGENQASSPTQYA